MNISFPLTSFLFFPFFFFSFFSVFIYYIISFFLSFFLCLLMFPSYFHSFPVLFFSSSHPFLPSFLFSRLFRFFLSLYKTGIRLVILYVCYHCYWGAQTTFLIFVVFITFKTTVRMCLNTHTEAYTITISIHATYTPYFTSRSNIKRKKKKIYLLSRIPIIQIKLTN